MNIQLKYTTIVVDCTHTKDFQRTSTLSSIPIWRMSGGDGFRWKPTSCQWRIQVGGVENHESAGGWSKSHFWSCFWQYMYLY